MRLKLFTLTYVNVEYSILNIEPDYIKYVNFSEYKWCPGWLVSTNTAFIIRVYDPDTSNNFLRMLSIGIFRMCQTITF